VPTSKRPELLAQRVHAYVDTLAELAGHDRRLQSIVEFVNLAADGEGRFFSIDYKPYGTKRWEVSVYLGASWTHPDREVSGTDDHWLRKAGVTMADAVERVESTLALVRRKEGQA
jgi:hypothetical protein